MLCQNCAARCEIRNYRANLAALHSLPFSGIWRQRLRNKPAENHETSAQQLSHPEKVMTAYCAREHSEWIASQKGARKCNFPLMLVAQGAVF